MESITWQDVMEFLALGLSEGVRLDYKETVPTTIEKHLAAFANTQGGMLLIGVQQNRDTGAPIAPPACVELAGLDARIEQKGLDAIYPGFVPEVRLVENPERPGFGVVVVRVHESPQAPHAIQNASRMYVRTGQRSMPEDLADLGRVERLLARRAERASLRDQRIDEAHERAESLYPLLTWSSIAVSALYPDATLRPPPAVLDWAQQRFSSERFYPRAGGAAAAKFDPTPVPPNPERLEHYFELSATGLYFVARSWEIGPAYPSGPESLNLQFVTHILAKDLVDASDYLGWVGIHGTVIVKYVMRIRPNVALDWTDYREAPPPRRPEEYSHRASLTCPASTIVSPDTVIALINELRWSMGYREFTRPDWIRSVVAAAQQQRP